MNFYDTYPGTIKLNGQMITDIHLGDVTFSKFLDDNL